MDNAPEYNQEYGQTFNGPPPQHIHAPSQQQVTNVIINQPQGMANGKLLVPLTGNRDWSTGLCACCEDIGKCCFALFCYNCVMADITGRMGECLCLTCCVPGSMVAMRARLRTMGGIQGSICNDYVALTCCHLCAVCQMHRELDHMGL